MSAPATAPRNIDENAPLLWTPTAEQIKNSRLFAFKALAEKETGQSFPDYHSLWQWTVTDVANFWNLAWDFMNVIGEKGGTVLAQPDKMPGATFFPQAKINYAENLLRRRDTSTAIIFRNEKGEERTLSFEELYNQVSQVRQGFEKAGIQQGDRVAGFMPNMPETLICHLAAASMGAIWSSASPDFGVQGVLDRFGQTEPKILVTVDGYFYNGKNIDCAEKLKAILEKLPSVQTTLIVPFLNKQPELGGIRAAQNYDEWRAAFTPADIAFARLPFNHPLVIMFSSGTTGIPKCIVHGHGGTLLTHMKEHQLQCDIQRDDKVFYFTTCGWMMWNWQISALASEAVLMLFDGSPFYPDGYVLWDYTSKHKCKLFGTSAKFIDASKAAWLEPGKKCDLSSITILTSTGSPLVHESFDYIYQHVKKDIHVASVSGGTDIISCFVIGNPLSPVYRGEIQGAGLAYAIDAYDDNGKPQPAGESGEMVCTQPFPSMPVAFWNDPDGKKYKAAYFERFANIWHHGDWLEKTPHNGFIIHGRSDATLNPGGVRIGTAEIYRQVEQIPEVLESIAVGQDWDNDVRVILFVRLKDGFTMNDDLISRIKKQIRDGASPRHVPAKILQVSDIPRTKNNKIVELAVREVIHKRPVKNVESLANPEALDLYKDLEALKA
ncbi:MAG: acetoacetate--CoA ligase [Alphaproteobacteria bacterium]|nr:acetoacetate--CoA ligase [Alphaproteobacteria bacterium]